MLEKKKVAEWLMYVKVTEAKIKKHESKLLENVAIVSTVSQKERNQAQLEQQESDIKATYQAYTQLIKNRDAVRKAILKFNAGTVITVAGEDMPLAYGLDKWNKRNEVDSLHAKFRNSISIFENKKAMAERTYNLKKDEWLSKILGGSRVPSEKEKEIAEENARGFEAVIIDPIDIKAVYEAMEDNQTAFMEELNMAINIANATHEIEVELN